MKRSTIFVGAAALAVALPLAAFAGPGDSPELGSDEPPAVSRQLDHDRVLDGRMDPDRYMNQQMDADHETLMNGHMGGDHDQYMNQQMDADHETLMNGHMGGDYEEFMNGQMGGDYDRLMERHMGGNATGRGAPGGMTGRRGLGEPYTSDLTT